jgi:hypothetical protein
LTVYCLRCGEPMQMFEGTFMCVRGEMRLTRILHDKIVKAFVAKARSAQPQGLVSWGTWYCPGCGVPATRDGEHVRCEQCSMSLDEFIHLFFEHHPHRNAKGDAWC